MNEYSGLSRKYARDGVHPNMDGYAIMEAILLDNMLEVQKKAQKKQKKCEKFGHIRKKQ